MQPIVLVENEATAGGVYDHWQDVTGERYQFPNQYKRKMVPGRRFLYYRGVRRADGKRGIAEYFGHGLIGDVELDPTNDPEATAARRKWICTITEFQEFPNPVPAKIDGQFLEDIPKNFWGVGVRDLDEEVYQKILALAGVRALRDAAAVLADLELPDLASLRVSVATNTLLPPTRRRAESGLTSSGASSARRSRYSAALGRRGEEVVYKHLSASLTEQQAKTLRWLAKEGETPGWDIQYTGKNGLVCLEVKASSGPALPMIELTANEWRAAADKRENYALVLVANVRSANPVIEFVSDPFGLVSSGSLAVEPLAWGLRRPQ